jgi:uncharacterized membrane protein HdeD (DUF308 family)
MSKQAVSPGHGTSKMRSRLSEASVDMTGYGWLWLVTGIVWILISLVILQFDVASVNTVGVLIGTMFLLASIQNFALTAVPGGVRWIGAIFGVLFLISSAICFISPVSTFVAMADILGYLFFLVGVWWMIQAFMERPVNHLWWLGLISGILMTILAFWTAGQFFLERAYLLIVFAGIWALMEGVTDITRAFATWALQEQISSRTATEGSRS